MKFCIFHKTCDESHFCQVLGDREFPGLRKLRALDLSNSPRLNLVSAQAFQVFSCQIFWQLLHPPLTFQDLSNLAWLSLSGSPSLSLQSGALLPLTGLRTVHLADLGWTRLDRFSLPTFPPSSVKAFFSPVIWPMSTSETIFSSPLPCPGTWFSGKTCTRWTWRRTRFTATANSPGSETSSLRQVCYCSCAAPIS